MFYGQRTKTDTFVRFARRFYQNAYAQGIDSCVKCCKMTGRNTHTEETDVETVQARLSEEDRAALEAVAADLTDITGSPVTMTGAFAYLLRNLPDHIEELTVSGDTGPLVVQMRMVLPEEQVNSIDAIALFLAERKAAILGGEAEPNRSDAVRFVVRTAKLEGELIK